jgi:hypothetical protein
VREETADVDRSSGLCACAARMSLRVMREEKETKESISEVVATKRAGETRGSGTFSVSVLYLPVCETDRHDQGFLIMIMVYPFLSLRHRNGEYTDVRTCMRVC